jgi:diaminopimelate decarboxylase
MLPPSGVQRADVLARVMTDVAARYEGPFLLFDFGCLQQVLGALEDIQRRQRCRFLVPVKSFPHPDFLELANHYLAGFDVSNLAEYRLLPADLVGKTVALTAPVLRVEDLPSLCERGNELLVFVDSPYQAAQLESFGTPLRYGIRLDGAALLNDLPRSAPARRDRSRFGLSPLETATLRSLLASSRHRFAGFHVHHGSERNDSETYTAMAQRIETLRREMGIEIECVDLGGGQHHMGLPAFERAIAGVRRGLAGGTQLYFEPGRLLTSGAGYAVGRVENWKSSEEAFDYVLDLSLDCHLRWSNPTLIVPQSGEAERPVLVGFYGPTCHEEDRLGHFCLWTGSGGPPPFAPGDLVLFGNISGYSASVRTSFNGVGPLPIHFVPSHSLPRR